MTCARVETLLALRVEGELGLEKLRAVEMHLTECPACRAVAVSYEHSRSFLRSIEPAPFDEQDFAAIRRAVRERLDEEATRSTLVRRIIFFLEGKRGELTRAEEALGSGHVRRVRIFLEGKRGSFMLAAACVLLAAIALRPSVENERPAIRPGAPQALFRSKQTPVPALGPTLVARSGDAKALFPSKQEKFSGPRGPAVPIRPAIASAVSRIELQTANPNVRIIWLLGSQPAAPQETDSEDGI